jgi:hypothetical protein
VEALEDRALLSTFVVDRLTDTGAGAGLAGDLRYCIGQANASPGDDTLTFSVTGTINLSRGLPSLSTNIAIRGPGAGSLTVRRQATGGYYRIFTVGRGATVSISGLTITNGNAGDDGGGIFIYPTGTLTLNNATVSHNHAEHSGAGISNNGTLTLNNATVSSNDAYSLSGEYGGPGGGIFNFDSGTVTLNNSTVSGNSSWEGEGGGIASYGTLRLNNSTVSGNSTFFNNGGGGIAGGTVTARNTIIAGNTAPTAPDLSGRLGSLGHNLIGNTSGGSGFAPTDLLDIDPVLGPLQDNGGPTRTMALLAGSPALNAGDSDQLGVADQRGVVRSGGVNIGAYQASASAFALTGLPDSAVAGTALTVTVTAQDHFGQTALGYRGTARFGSSDGQADLPGDYAFVAADNGMHTFPGGVTLETAGSQSITATDAGSLTGGAAVAVTPAAADHLLLTGPDGAGAGVPFDLTLTVQDAYGNTVTGYTGTVTFATDDPDGALPEDYTFTAEDAGSHTFSGGGTLYADGSRITVTDTEVDTLTGSLVITFG